MKMANHPRPGDIIQESLDELNVSLREFARAMEIAPSTASRLLTGKAALTPEMAIKLSVVIGSSPQMWLNLQNAWSLAEAEKRWMCRDCAVWLRNKKWRFLKRHFQLKVQKRLYPFFTLFFASAFSISRYQRGWCFFAQRRLTFPSIIPLIDPFTQNAIYIWIRMAWIRMIPAAAWISRL